MKYLNAAHPNRLASAIESRERSVHCPVMRVPVPTIKATHNQAHLLTHKQLVQKAVQGHRRIPVPLHNSTKIIDPGHDMAPIAVDSPPLAPSRPLQKSIHNDQSRTQSLPKTSKAVASYQGYDHVAWWVGNAKQAAAFYVTRMGFERVAYSGLETGSRVVASHVVRNGHVTFVLSSPLHTPTSKVPWLTEDDRSLLRQMHDHLESHGDAVRDVAFEVDDVVAVYESAIEKGAHSAQTPYTSSDDFGSVVRASIRTYGDTIHTLIQRRQYKGAFLPGYRAVMEIEKTSRYLPQIELVAVDHCVGKSTECILAELS
jgi:catechol 2,3-dioxygenase-like lactoylglutathione lyase family enzyme